MKTTSIDTEFGVSDECVKSQRICILLDHIYLFHRKNLILHRYEQTRNLSKYQVSMSSLIETPDANIFKFNILLYQFFIIYQLSSFN